MGAVCIQRLNAAVSCCNAVATARSRSGLLADGLDPLPDGSPPLVQSPFAMFSNLRRDRLEFGDHINGRISVKFPL